jgi:hypothetical protein
MNNFNTVEIGGVEGTINGRREQVLACSSFSRQQLGGNLGITGSGY